MAGGRLFVPRGRACVSPFPISAGHLTARSRSGHSLRVGDALVPALTAASGDSSSEYDHSPRSLPVAVSDRDTGGLAALPPAPTPPSAPIRRLHSAPSPARPTRSLGCNGSFSAAAPATIEIRSIAARLMVLALICAVRANSPSKPTPCGGVSCQDSTRVGWRARGASAFPAMPPRQVTDSG